MLNSFKVIVIKYWSKKHLAWQKTVALKLKNLWRKQSKRTQERVKVAKVKQPYVFYSICFLNHFHFYDYK